MNAVKRISSDAASKKVRMAIEKTAEGEAFECCPIGKYVVLAPGVCGGRPTIKGTRVEVRAILHLLRSGKAVHEIVRSYPRVSAQAVEEVIELAAQAFHDKFTHVEAA